MSQEFSPWACRRAAATLHVTPSLCLVQHATIEKLWVITEAAHFLSSETSFQECESWSVPRPIPQPVMSLHKKKTLPPLSSTNRPVHGIDPHCLNAL